MERRKVDFLNIFILQLTNGQIIKRQWPDDQSNFINNNLLRAKQRLIQVVSNSWRTSEKYFLKIVVEYFQ